MLNTIRSQKILTNSWSFMIAAISESLFPSILRSLMFAAKEQKAAHVGLQRFLFCIGWSCLHATFLKTNKRSEWARKSQKPGGGTPHMKGVGMLVVSLRGVNFGFWSCLGCSRQNAIIFSHESLI